MRRPLRSQRAVTSPRGARSEASGSACAPLPIASSATSVFSAAMRSPLRSKRAITSPLRARSKASGLTRIRVRLTAGAPLLSIGFRSLLLLLLRSGRRWCLLLARGRLAALRGPFAGRPLALAAQRFLAVGAERPARVDRFATARAGVLEAALALRAAHVVH